MLLQFFLSLVDNEITECKPDDSVNSDNYYSDQLLFFFYFPYDYTFNPTPVHQYYSRLKNNRQKI